MLLNDTDIRTSGPIALMQHSLSSLDFEDITRTLVKLFTHLATIDTFTQNKFKRRICDKIQENPVTRKENEKLIQYLQRHFQVKWSLQLGANRKKGKRRR